MRNFKLTSWQEYWKLFDELIDLLEKSNQTTIISEFKDAQKYVNGLTDGWYEYLYVFEKSLKSNRRNMTKDQTEIADYLIKYIKNSLRNR